MRHRYPHRRHSLRRLHPVIPALLVLMVGGCGVPLSLQAPVPPSTYLLEWRPAAAEPAPAAAGRPSLAVSPPQAAPGFNGTGIVYVRTPYRLDSYARHRWVDAPARLLEPLLVRALETSGLFSAVTSTDTGVRSDLRLDTELLYLQQVFDNGGSEVQLALRARLIDRARARLIAAHQFTLAEPVRGAGPYAAVQAANRALARLLDGLRTFLAAQPAGAGAPADD